MANPFSQILDGKLPPRSVWSDERCVAFLSSEPLRPGHVVVAPREPVAEWLKLRPTLVAHLTEVAQMVGKALHGGFGARKVGMTVVDAAATDQTHINLVPINSDSELVPASRQPLLNERELDSACEVIRAELAAMGLDRST